MDDSRMDIVWNLMSQYTFQAASGAIIGDDMRCMLCNNLMIDACHSVCCCHYCRKCIREYIGDGARCCPGGKTKCGEGFLNLDMDLMRDTRVNNRISHLKVICPNELCRATIQLNRMYQHLNTCGTNATECPFTTVGCGNRNEPKEAIVTHLSRATFSHSQLLIVFIKKLNDELAVMKSDFEMNKLELLALKEDSKAQILKMADHFSEQNQDLNERMKKQSIEFMERAAEQKKEVDQIKEQLVEKENQIAVIGKEIIELKNTKRSNSKEIVKGGEDKNAGEEDQLKVIIGQIQERDEEMRYVKEDSLANNNKIAILEEQIEKMKTNITLRLSDITKDAGKIKADVDYHKKDINTVIMAQQKGMHSVKEDVAKIESRIVSVEKQLKEAKNEMEFKFTTEREEVKKSMVVHEREIILAQHEGKQAGEKVLFQLTNLKNEFGEMKTTVNKHMTNVLTLLPTVNVDIIWRIEGWTKKRETMRATRIFSDSFYSNNYRMCLYLWIDNYGNIVLRCLLMRGDNDDNVQWPMRKAVTLSLLNQDTLRPHRSVSSQYDTYKYDKTVFDRPKNDMNSAGIGASSLIDYSSIKDKTSIIVNDSIVVSCVVTDP